MAGFWSKLRQAGALAAMLVAAHQAQAAGTTAGTDVTNTATVNYQIGATPAPAVPASITFKVDRRITLTVAEVGGVPRYVEGSATNQVVTFTLTNTSNADLDFALALGQMTNGTTVLGGGADNFDVAMPRFFVDNGAVNGYDAGDTQVTHIDSLDADAVRTIYVVADIPASQVNGDRAGITLLATAREDNNATGLGDAITQTAGADTANAVDTVFGDLDGPAVSGDVARDGQHSDDGSYLVDVTTLTVTKTSKVISDPINTTTNPKAIPGATVEYCLVLMNTGAQTINNIAITDALPAQTTFVAGSLESAVTIDGSNLCSTTAGTTEDDNATDADESDPNGASFASPGGTPTVAGTVGSLTGMQKTGFRFKVTIN